MFAAGIFIVFDYLGQRKEELEAEDEESRKNPTFVVQAPNGAMRTTYDAAPYDPAANPNGAGGGRGRGIVFLAWGAWAAKRVAKLDMVRPIQSVIPALHLIPRALPAHTVVRKGISS